MRRIINFNGKHHRSSSGGEFVQMTKCKKKNRIKKIQMVKFKTCGSYIKNIRKGVADKWGEFTKDSKIHPDLC